MRLFVRSVEEEEADWYAILLKIESMQQQVAVEGGASAQGGLYTLG